MDSKFDLNAYIMHHVLNSQEWALPFAQPIPLPGFLSKHGLMMFIGAAIVLVTFLVFYRKNDRVPTGLTNCLESLIVLVRDQIAIPNLGEQDGLLFTPMLCTLGFFILTLNLLGLIPLFSAATGNINVTFCLAFLVFVLLVFGTLARGIQKGGVMGGVHGFWHALMPSGLPGWLIGPFFLIEILSLCVRSTVLCLRLFMNMFAGHVVILVFLGLVTLFGWYAFPAVLIAIFLYCLEVLIAFLQAYIFVLLTAIFIGQMYHPQH